MNAHRLVVSVFAVLGLVLAGGCATTDFVTGRQVQNMYLIEDDIQMGREVLSDVVKAMQEDGVRVNADARKVAKLQDMVNRIAAVSHLPTLPYEVKLFHTNIVNAFAAPGGQMGVFTGLYDHEIGLVKDDDELAAVIAHEIAHVTCRHTTESLTREMPMQLLLLGAAIYAEAKDKEDLAIALGAGFLLYQGLLLPKYSRADEAEADAVGMMYMAKAGYDPRAAVRLWKRAYEREGDEGLFALFSSHPTNKARYESLQKMLPQAMEEYNRVKSAKP